MTDDGKENEPAKSAHVKHPHRAVVTKLDGQKLEIEVDRACDGAALFDKVCALMELNEVDYFGLTYRDAKDRRRWLSKQKRISRQVSGE